MNKDQLKKWLDRVRPIGDFTFIKNNNCTQLNDPDI